METTVTVKSGHLPQSVQESLCYRASKLPRFFDRMIHIPIIADMQHDQPTVEIIVSAEEVEDFFAADSGANVVSAFDGAIDKIEIQLKKHKEKLKGRRSHESKLQLVPE